MGAGNQQYTYEIKETPDSLVITWQGHRDWKQASSYLIRLLFYIALFLITSIEFLSPAAAPTPSARIWRIITLILMWSFISITFFIPDITSALDHLLNHETIQISADRFFIEKYGWLSIRRRDYFQLNDRYFLTIPLSNKLKAQLPNPQSQISLSNPKSMGCLRSLLREGINHHPMQRFCRGISSDDCLEVLQRIKAKFPELTVIHHTHQGVFSEIG
jgi:hypothetical protein